MEAPEDTDSSSDVWDVRHIQLQPADLRRIMWIRDMLEVTIPIMETASHPGKRRDMAQTIQLLTGTCKIVEGLSRVIDSIPFLMSVCDTGSGNCKAWF